MNCLPVRRGYIGGIFPVGDLIVPIDGLTGLCPACGSLQTTPATGHNSNKVPMCCPLCGSFATTSESEIAQLVRGAHPSRLREHRLKLVELTSPDWRRGGRLSRCHPGDVEDRDAADRAVRSIVRAAFLASVGAVATPVQLYALWLDTWEQQSPKNRRTTTYNADFPGAGGRGEGLYSSTRVWTPTLVLRGDEIPATYGPDSLLLLVPPHLARKYRASLPLPGDPSVDTGHTDVFVLGYRWGQLTAWTSTPSRVFSYADVEELRHDRATMTAIRRAWKRRASAHTLGELL